MTKGRKLDAATEQQAIAFVRRYIEIRGGLSRDWQLWRATRKQELCGQPELPDEWVRKYKEWISDLEQVKAHFGRKDIDRVATRIQRRYEAQISKRPLTWDPKVAAKLFAAAKQGNPDADQVLREVAAAYLERGELPPKPLLDYTAKYLRAPSGGKRATQRSLETESRNRRLARLVHAVSQKFGLNATRGRDPKNTKDDYRPDCASP